MHINLKTFHNEDFTCPNCSWKGKGSELDTENVSEEHWIFDFECPECDQRIGSGQALLSNNYNFSKDNYSKDINDGSIS